MSTAIAPLAIYDFLFPGVVPDASLKPGVFKDLSAGGACETGYGDRTKIHQSLQYLANFKHSEKSMPYLRWAVTVMPAILDVLPRIIYHQKKRTPLCDIPSRAYTVLKEEISNISPKQLGFLLSVIPLYHNARSVKNHILPGDALDPSGHTLFKIAQYGMMYSIATGHGTKSRISNASISYLAVTAIADVFMLTNTIAHCHTFVEIAVGVALGIAVLLTAHLISKHTPLGESVQRVAKVVSNKKGELNYLPEQMPA